MHLFDKSVNFLGGHGIVGAHLPLARGPASRSSTRAATRWAVLLRRGAVPEGEFHESMNLPPVEASGDLHLREQPLRDGHRDPSRAGPDDISLARRRTAFPDEAVDGMTCWRCGHGGAGGRAGAARQDPHAVEARTYRFRGHSCATRPARCTAPRKSRAREAARSITLFSDRCLKEAS